MGRHEVTIDQHGLQLAGDLGLPPEPAGLVLFAHGSGSSRFSSRNRAVARRLNDLGLATLLLDLLTADEEVIDARTAELRFDIPLLAQRLTGTVDWTDRQPALAALPLGLFGASTGAAAALITAAARPQRVAAVVSRGGRPDLALPVLDRVRAPTLLIVGGHDREVLALNRQALAALGAHKALDIVPGATHLFEEPGALEQVAQLAGDWFLRHLQPAAAP
jgi:dienelactone hydrolase